MNGFDQIVKGFEFVKGLAINGSLKRNVGAGDVIHGVIRVRLQYGKTVFMHGKKFARKVSVMAPIFRQNVGYRV